MADFTLPELGENVTAGDVLRVLVKAGDTVAKDQTVLELETDKATIEVPSSVAGRVATVSVKAGDKVKVGQLVLTVEDGAGQAVATPAAAPGDRDTTGKREDAGGGTVVDGGRGVRASAEPAPPGLPSAPAAPSVRRLARELGVEIDGVSGSGEDGRISIEDVKAHARRLLERVSRAGGDAAPGGPTGEVTLPDFSRWGDIERQPMRPVRRKTAEHLSAAWHAIPHVTQHELADVTELEELRKKYVGVVEEAGGSLTITAIAVKVVAAALKLFPQFNASIALAAEEIILKKYVNVGIAVDTDRGLLVPVVRNADTKNILQIAVEVARLSAKARDRTIALEEMQGGCFTISNLGGIGGTHFTPIVNAPELAILGISRARMEPVYRDRELVPRLMLPLSLSYDHRAIDGADGIRFLRWVVEALERPFLLALQG